MLVLYLREDEGKFRCDSGLQIKSRWHGIQIYNNLDQENRQLCWRNQACQVSCFISFSSGDLSSSRTGSRFGSRAMNSF